MDDSGRAVDVAVVGGGFAGIAAAVALADDGKRVTLIESRPYLGGRVRSFTHIPSGWEIDNGQHLLMGSYRATFRLLRRLGTDDAVRPLHPLSIAVRRSDGKPDSLSAPGWLPPPLSTLYALLRFRNLSLGDLWNVGRFAAGRRAPREAETATDWMARNGQSTRLIDQLWEPLTLSTLNTPIEIASARLLDRVIQDGLLATGDDARFYFPERPLSELTDPESLKLRVGVEVKLSAPVRRVTGSREEGFTLETPTRSIGARSVVLATQPATAARLLPAPSPSLDHFLGVARYSPILNGWFWYDGDVKLPRMTMCLDSMTEWVFDRGTMHGETLVTSVVSAAGRYHDLPRDSVEIQLAMELEGLFPELSGAQLRRVLLIEEKRATLLSTPEIESARPQSIDAVPGIALAGDWTDTGYPGTIEGAARSGETAAEIIGEWI